MPNWESDWKDYYVILGLFDELNIIGIGPAVTSKRLKEVWEFERKKWHPDNFKSGSQAWDKAHERFVLIDEAYEALRDPAKKEKYDNIWKAHWQWKAENKSRLKTPNYDNGMDDEFDWGSPKNMHEATYNHSRDRVYNHPKYSHLKDRVQRSFFDASFMWWWVVPLIINFLLSIILPSLLAGVLSVAYEHIVNFTLDACVEMFGGILCTLLLLAVIWWLILIFLIIILILWALIYILNYVWPTVSPFVSLYFSISFLSEIMPPNVAFFTKKRWKHILAAIISLPLSYWIFSTSFSALQSPIEYKGVQVSGGGPWIGRFTILPTIFENLWFILFGTVGLVITLFSLMAYYNYKEHTHNIATSETK